jgi:hypothetical protein
MISELIPAALEVDIRAHNLLQDTANGGDLLREKRVYVCTV